MDFKQFSSFKTLQFSYAAIVHVRVPMNESGTKFRTNEMSKLGFSQNSFIWHPCDKQIHS